MTDLTCPLCGTGLSITHLLVNADDRAVVVRLLALSTPLGAAVGRYIGLFTPPKTSLTLRKQVRIVLQLLPDLERGAITHRGRDWQVPTKVWEAGIDQMLAARDAGKLALPMKGHGYLYAILVGLADKVEGAAEAQAEDAKRHPARQDTAANPAMTIAQDLVLAFAQRDQLAAPMPAELRARLNELKGGKR